MATLTRRSVLRGSLGLAAAGALMRPYLTSAAATTVETWWNQGYLPEEELQLLDGAITAAYQRVGISPSDPETWVQPPPLTGDFQQAIEDGALDWADVRELGQVIVGRYPVRKQQQDVTLFESLGIAIEDVTTASRVYQKAVAEGVGRMVEW